MSKISTRKDCSNSRRMGGKLITLVKPMLKLTQLIMCRAQKMKKIKKESVCFTQNLDNFWMLAKVTKKLKMKMLKQNWYQITKMSKICPKIPQMLT